MPLATKEAQREYQRLWILQRRQAWLDRNGPCRNCGTSDNLEVDHIDPNSKALNPARLWSLSDKNPLKIAELAKCQVLCETCHKAKTKAFIEVTGHGNITQYRHGCRCTPCKESATLDRRRYARN